MRLRHSLIWLCSALTALMACQSQVSERNPFLGYTEEYGVPGESTTTTTSGSGTASGTTLFRAEQVLTFRNNNQDADLFVTFVAWVNVGSIRSADQQDALLRGGFMQLARETRLGTAVTLPVGTFVYKGSGTAGATDVRLGPAAAGTGGAAATPATQTFNIVTPDGVLAFVQPPVSCESVAFVFSKDGDPLTSVPVGGGEGPFGGSTTTGGYKTLAQVDAYSCDPFTPGLFFSRGGQRQANQYFEGYAVTFDFNAVADASGNFCTVTISASTSG
jgi:hypothetical protein